jgi:hypothetical protein
MNGLGVKTNIKAGKNKCEMDLTNCVAFTKNRRSEKARENWKLCSSNSIGNNNEDYTDCMQKTNNPDACAYFTCPADVSFETWVK